MFLLFFFFLWACAPAEMKVDSGGDSGGVYVIGAAPSCPIWYADADEDGYGDPATFTASCTQPPGYVADNTDCDDARAVTNPGADEFCNGIDDDCDGAVDRGATTPWYYDGDGDNYGDPRSERGECIPPWGYVPRGGDCNDADPAINPGATEVHDGVDNDCDGVVR